MNSAPEQNLERFRLAPPSSELRARVLAAARQEWGQPVPASEWAPLKRPLLAIAASLVLAAAGSWTNHRLVSPAVVASAPPSAENIPEQELVQAEPPTPPPFIHPGAKYPIRKAAMAALGTQQNQALDLLEEYRGPAGIGTAPSHSRPFRQISPGPASRC